MLFKYQSDGHIKGHNHSVSLWYIMEYDQLILMLVLHKCILQTLAHVNRQPDSMY